MSRTVARSLAALIMIVSIAAGANAQIRNSQTLFAEQPPLFQDHFGEAVAVSTNAVVVGSYRDQVHLPGAVYVYPRSGDLLQSDDPSILLPENGQDGDYFGIAVAADGETILAARFPFGQDLSFVEIWVLPGNSWERQAVLQSGLSNDKFGQSVAVSGDYAAVGAPLDESSGERTGAVYVYRREPSTGEWNLDEKLVPSSGFYDEQFGTSVAIDGVTLAVGAPNQDEGRGGVYVFEREDSGWVQRSVDDPPFDMFLARFGRSVSVSDRRFVVGAPTWREPAEPPLRTGLAFVYEKNAVGQYRHVGTLSHRLPADMDRFGRSVAIEGNTVLVGAAGRELGGVVGHGAVYLFRWNGIEWLPDGLLGTTFDENGYPILAGSSVALNDGMAVSGAPGPASITGMAGRAFVYGDILGGGEPVRLIDINPLDGSVDNPTNMTARLVFSAPLDTTASFGGEEGAFLVVETYPDFGDPLDIRLSEDSTVLEADFSLLPDAKYTLLLLAARSASTGGGIDRPYTTTFTTGSQLPSGQITGKVTASPDPVGSIVALFASTESGVSSIFSDEDNISAFGVVADPSGTFTVPYLSDGHYVAVAVRDDSRDGELDFLRGDAFGVHDATGEGVADAILVEGGSPATGVDITIGLPVEGTAGDRSAGALAAARGVMSNSVLVSLSSELDPENGTSGMWSYVFFSPPGEHLSVGAVGTQYVLSPFFPDEVALDVTAALPDVWLDSDDVVAIANANGGQDFLDAHPSVEAGTVLGNLLPSPGKTVLKDRSRVRGAFGQLSGRLWSGPSRVASLGGTPAWSLGYWAPTDQDAFLAIVIHAETGEVNPILVSTQPGGELPSTVALHANYPNPFNPATTIRYDLPAQSEVALAVFDVLGRRVRVLASGAHRAGTHEVTFDATGLTSGVYFCRLTTDSSSLTRSFVLLR